LPKRVLSVEEIMAILPTSVARLTELTDGMTEAELRREPEPGTWSVNDVLAHLRACGDVLGGNMVRIITEDHPAWKAMNPRTWQRKSDYHDWRFGPAFEAFVRQRTELLEVLRALPPEGWDRTATVSVPPAKQYEYSVAYYGDWLAAHERAHLNHLPKVIAVVAKRS
jgi:DinB superfamily